MGIRVEAFAVSVAFALAFVASPAVAEECTGTDVSELVTGCSVLVDNEDFFLKLYASCGHDVSTPSGIKDTLDRVLVFVHGYGVDNSDLPSILREDGTTEAIDELGRSGIAVIGMAAGSSKTDRVEDDAAALEAALRLVEGYRNAAALPLVVFGHSMGGLLARIALSKMEADGGHDVGLYVSYDSPHSGVNVPQGMQNLKVKLDAWAAMTEADFIAVDSGWKGVFKAADMFGISTVMDPDSIKGVPDPITLQAQQMTIQSVKGPAEHAAFMTLLSDIGFPQVRKIAVSNGNTQGVANSQIVEPGGELFSFTGAKGNSFASVRLTFEIFTDKPEATCFKSDVYYDGTARNHSGGRKDATTPADIVMMDHLSGGTLDYSQEMGNAAKAARGLHNPSHRASVGNAIPFVPTSSAFALDVGTENDDLAGIVAANGTPFDAAYAIGDLPAFEKNIDHNTIVMPDALLAEIKALMPGFKFSGPDQDDDGVSDVCDKDVDGDGILNGFDNCPTTYNPDQADRNRNGIGDVCEDGDRDGIPDTDDNCPTTYNPDQTDSDDNGVGDVCDSDWLWPSEPTEDVLEHGCLGCSASPGIGIAGLLLVLGLRGRRRKRIG